MAVWAKVRAKRSTVLISRLACLLGSKGRRWTWSNLVVQEAFHKWVAPGHEVVKTIMAHCNYCHREIQHDSSCRDSRTKTVIKGCLCPERVRETQRDRGARHLPTHWGRAQSTSSQSTAFISSAISSAFVSLSPIHTHQGQQATMQA